MLHHLPARGLAFAASLLAFNVAAQAPAAPAPASAASAPQSTPAYHSALEGYQPFTDEKLRSWKQANDTVGKIGGWRVYAKEAAGAPTEPGDATDRDAKAPASPAAPQPAQPAAGAVKPPAGHGHH